MISISRTHTLDKTPQGRGDSFDLMIALLRARQAADNGYSLAKQAEHGRYPFLAKFWNELAELQMEILRRTATAVERVKEESQACASDKGDLITDEPKPTHQREAGPKSAAE